MPTSAKKGRHGPHYSRTEHYKLQNNLLLTQHAGRYPQSPPCLQQPMHPKAAGDKPMLLLGPPFKAVSIGEAEPPEQQALGSVGEVITVWKAGSGAMADPLAGGSGAMTDPLAGCSDATDPLIGEPAGCQWERGEPSGLRAAKCSTSGYLVSPAPPWPGMLPRSLVCSVGCGLRASG